MVCTPPTSFNMTWRTPGPPHDMEVPPWVEVPENYYVASCRMQRYMDSYAAVVVFCRKPGSIEAAEWDGRGYAAAEWDGRGYAKVYVYDDDQVQPFPQMKGIIQEMRRHKLNYPSPTERLYELSEDGKIRESMTQDIPSDEALHEAAVLMMTLHERWRDYPNIDSFDMVERLEKAKEAIRRMNDEETYGHTKKRIEDIRQSIKAEQEQIAQIERGLNSMYEAAADAMNLLEENGIDPNHFDDKPKEVDGKPGGIVGTVSRYIGTADILELTPGNVFINPMDLSYNPRVGDVVFDPKNGQSAVLDEYGRWQLVFRLDKN